MRAARTGTNASPRRETSRGPARVSIGALSRATGIPPDTIRTWERRYGFPRPARKPSGHRAYAFTDVPRLRRIAELTARGVRTGDAIAASEQQLRELLAETGGSATASRGERPAPASTDDLLRSVEACDGATLVRRLTIAWGHLGALGFVRDSVAPLVEAVGREWAAGRLGIRHEHFLAERLQDVLRTLRLPLEERADGPLVVLGTLPGEPHALGLHMVALLLNSAGCRVAMLGADLPAAEIATVAIEHRAAAVGISVSHANAGPAMDAQVRALRRMLPPRIALVLGGAGAPTAAPNGVTVLRALDEADGWARRLARTGRWSGR